MPDQAEHEKPENMVEDPNPKIYRARSLPEEASSNNSLDGYAAMNVPARKQTVDDILANEQTNNEQTNEEKQQNEDAARETNR